MEGNLKWSLVTAVAPVAWGTTYFVTREYLPESHPLYGAAFRAVPAGLLLLAVCRKLPRGSWWWKSLVLGALNMSGFFALVYVAAQRLPHQPGVDHHGPRALLHDDARLAAGR
ncbi:EamA family transporter OS=Streptomyces microflavus OX=1919 GN=G3I39_06985 PE=4 SV=1 [Streptomyces microflavus]